MTEIRRCSIAGVPPARVWALLLDVGQLEAWSPSTTAVEGPAQLSGVGDQFTQTVVVAGRSFSSRWRVERFEPERRIALSGKLLPGVSVEMDETLAEHAGGTEVCLTMRYKMPFGPVGRLAGRLGLAARAGAEAQQVLEQIVRAAEREPAVA
ncbi:MAG: SRPBCC family protein [Acidimicrobiales bacterium]|nr:SRPBCC family protein [Acidimicrobiales bacterium]